MKENELLEGLKKVVPEGSEIDVSKLDVKALNAFVNEDTNNIVASKKTGFLEEGKKSFLTEKGFADVEAFDTFKTKAETSESDLLKKFNKLDGEHNTLKADHNKLNVQISTDKEVTQLTRGEGFRVDPKYAKFVHSEFATARNTAKASGKDLTMEEWGKAYFEKNAQYQMPIKTGTRHRGTVINTGKDVDNFYEERYAKRRKK